MKRGHVYYGAGSPDCPPELKASNGELHTLRCRHCGQDNPRDDICPESDFSKYVYELRQVAVEAYYEIQAHWGAHLDSEGYGPANLMRCLLKVKEDLDNERTYAASQPVPDSHTDGGSREDHVLPSGHCLGVVVQRKGYGDQQIGVPVAERVHVEVRGPVHDDDH